MRTTGRLMLLLALVMITIPAIGQEGRIGQLYFMEVEPENNAAWLEAYQKHVEFHRQSEDDWGWPVWSITTGPRTGQYVIGTFAHEWKDFDRDFESEDFANAWATMAPISESIRSEFWVYMPEYSRPPEDPAHSFMVVNYARLGMGMADQFWRAIGKISKALAGAGWPRHVWFSDVVNSGEAGWVVWTSPRSGFADMAPPSMEFDAIMTEAYGEDESEAIMDLLMETFEERHTELWTLLPELSYMPAD